MRSERLRARLLSVLFTLIEAAYLCFRYLFPV